MLPAPSRFGDHPARALRNVVICSLPMRWGRARTLALVSWVLAAGSLGFAPESSEQNLDYAKQLYADGEKAMEAGDFATAKAKYMAGYAYAPELHVFTFNIAMAADAAGECAVAKKYFQHFVDLVPKHAERDTAKKRLAELEKSCDQELPEAAPVEAPKPKDKRKTRAQIDAERSLNTALGELVRARDMYKQASKRHKQTRQIARAGRRKKRHAKRMRKLITELGVEVDVPERELPDVPVTVKDACRDGRSQEGKIISAMEEVLEHYDGKTTYRVVKRFIRWAERIDKPAFEECT